MSTVAPPAVPARAALHACILGLEMFPRARRARAAVGTTAEFAAGTCTPTAGQGPYNGFLTAGPVWGSVASDPVGFQGSVFFPVCVAVAGRGRHGRARHLLRADRTGPGPLALVLLAH